MDELFSEDEKLMLCLLVATSIRNNHDLIRRPGAKDAQKIMMKRQIDFSSVVMGKFLSTMNPDFRKKAEDVCKKSYGLELDVKHEKCPHKNV